MKTSVRHMGDFRWDGVDLLKYKEEDGTFRAINRQVLLKGDSSFPVEMRYFEIGPGGYSTLERHEHTHFVMIIRGKGKALVGEEIVGLGELDVFSVPPQTWHQLYAEHDQPLGFLCMVATKRDRPHRPSVEEFAQLQKNPSIASIVRS
jgi:quercetin dioxygenase-like cupin family protein